MGGERELLVARAAETLLTASDERALIESAISLLGDSDALYESKRAGKDRTTVATAVVPA